MLWFALSGLAAVAQTAAALLVAQSAPSQPAINLLGAAEQARVDAIVNDALAATSVPSVSLAVVRGGKVVYAQAYGAGRYRQGPRSMIAYPAGSGLHAPPPVMIAVPARTTMRYGAGSITKQFTATAILMLQQQGKLSVDDPVGKYLPGLTRANEVTLRELLSHTSGYQDYYAQDYTLLPMQKPTTAQAIIDGWAKKPLDFDPGTQWQYSNTGYVLLGQIVEKVSGQPFFDYLRQHIFTPLGMGSVGDLDTHDLGPNDAEGYMRYALGPPRPAVPDGSNWMYAAGDLCLTAQDLARWDIGFMDQALLQPASYAEMTTEVKLKSGAGTHYGFGVDVLSTAGADGKQHRLIEHSGEVSGFRSENMVFPEDKVAVAVLTNAEYSSASREVANGISAVLGLGPGTSSASKTTDEVREILKGLTAGTIDRDLFTANANGYFDEQGLQDFKNSLSPLGPVVSITQRGPDRLRGGMTYRGYALNYAGKQLSISTYWMADGKLEQYLVETVE